MADKHFDTVVIGSGVAGLSFLHYFNMACKKMSSQKETSVALFSKSIFSNTNTNWAQGGIASVGLSNSLQLDSIANHCHDTMVAGCYTNNEYIVKKVVEQGPQLMQDLLAMGMPFDTDANNAIDLAKEGGHGHARVWHVKDYTGRALQQTLETGVFKLNNVTRFENCCVTEICKIRDGLFEIKTYNTGSCLFETFTTNFVVLATGGVGQLYAQTTNTSIATGDGIYFAHKLGAAIKDLSYIQFHPTGLYSNHSSVYLITEALRGAGAVLRNAAGENFMPAYHASGSLAPRDIVSRAIINEMKKDNAPYVFLDATVIDRQTIESHFPSIKAGVQEISGIDITTTYIPIIPTQHYSCGGIQVNEYGQSTVQNLYAIGECASTGLHGANRLASNSLLEGMAFAKFAANQIANAVLRNNFDNVNVLPSSNVQDPPIQKVLDIDRHILQQTVSEYAGVVKTHEGLALGLARIQNMISQAQVLETFSTEKFETTCMATTALLLFEDAIAQTKNVGVFYNASIA
jgi:L-aspartate oxidase